MPLTPEQRKQLLGRGGLIRIARETGRTPGHVTEVNARGRPDPKVRIAITEAIVATHPDISPADVWPEGSAA